MKQLSRLLAGAAMATLLQGTGSAIDYDLSGNFTKDNDIAYFNFTVGGSGSTVTIFSSSWDDGGFDPILAVWDADTGSLIAEQDDGHNVGTTYSNGTPYDHGYWDSYYSVFLAGGDYVATVAQYDNFANGSNLADGFTYDGNPNYTFDQGYGGATQPYFNGVWDNNDPRTSYYAFHILGVQSATHNPPPPVPDGGSALTLLGLGLAGLLGVRVRSRN